MSNHLVAIKALAYDRSNVNCSKSYNFKYMMASVPKADKAPVRWTPDKRYGFYNVFILPATLSTASFNLNDCLTTISFSSSQHSAIKVVVSAKKPGRLI
jgi:hypothetical protein